MAFWQSSCHWVLGGGFFRQSHFWPFCNLPQCFFSLGGSFWAESSYAVGEATRGFHLCCLTWGSALNVLVLLSTFNTVFPGHEPVRSSWCVGFPWVLSSRGACRSFYPPGEDEDDFPGVSHTQVGRDHWAIQFDLSAVGSHHFLVCSLGLALQIPLGQQSLCASPPLCLVIWGPSQCLHHS